MRLLKCWLLFYFLSVPSIAQNNDEQLLRHKTDYGAQIDLGAYVKNYSRKKFFATGPGMLERIMVFDTPFLDSGRVRANVNFDYEKPKCLVSLFDPKIETNTNSFYAGPYVEYTNKQGDREIWKIEEEPIIDPASLTDLDYYCFTVNKTLSKVLCLVYKIKIGDYGTPEVWLYLRNNSKKRIIGIEGVFTLYNRFMTPVTWGGGTNRWGFVSTEEKLEPGECGWVGPWTLHLYESTRRLKVSIQKIYFE